jgi:hypothetical protein
MWPSSDICIDNYVSWDTVHAQVNATNNYPEHLNYTNLHNCIEVPDDGRKRPNMYKVTV